MTRKKVQKDILVEGQYKLQRLSRQDLLAIASGEKDLATVDNDKLVEFLQIANALYRKGERLISDKDYDFIFLEELKKRVPDHPFLHEVEPESLVEAKTVQLPAPMLSTEKAYSFSAIERWGKRIGKMAEECGIEFGSLIFRASPKLDGYAAYDDGQILYTRGNGRRGTDISRVFARGLQVAENGRRGLGPGEIVISRSYFARHLAHLFDNSRNFQASLIKEKKLDSPATEAIRLGKAVFFPFALLPNWRGTWSDIQMDFDAIIDSLWHKVDYDIDGVVLEIIDARLKDYMGATRHHYRWQIAYKKNTKKVEVKVVQVIPQTSRSGRVNPVAEIEPTRLSGALIRRATAHHYSMVRKRGVGPGALIRLSRSGEVIPKIEEVLVSVEPQLPESCPSCGLQLIWEKDYLYCVNNMGCTAQITNSIEHFFKTLGNIDGFGIASIKRIFSSNIRSVDEIYGLTQEDFIRVGFGPKQAQNMVAQLQRSLNESIEDWRFLAAFGIYRMGMGNCEKLLGAFPLARIFDLNKDEIVTIKGFSDKIANGILSGLRLNMDLFNRVFALGFNLIRTPLLEGSAGDAKDVHGPLFGKLLVFTGVMQGGRREEIKIQAKALGARVGDRITGKTDLLVCGEKVGSAKLEKAKSLNVQIISEMEYQLLVDSS